ncbi:MAG: SpoIIE family protein phosphatase [Chlorobi bacterium]|nr:SpoIIE family protein phosphatase [Chlorobiota bacterium]
MNLWQKISILGVNEEMPMYIQKSTILYNQIIRVLIVFFIIGSFITYFIGLRLIPVSFYIILPILAYTLYLNYRGKVLVSIFVVSIVLPLFFIALSIFAKTNGEGRSLYLYFIPRWLIIMFGLLPAALISFNNQKKAVLAMSTSIILFIFYDLIHNLFGIYITDMPYIHKHFIIFQGATTGIFFFVVLLIFFLQKINLNYEQIVVNQRDELFEKNEEITAQKEEIETQSEKIFIQNKNITDSILYAQRIQSAILPSKEKLSSNFPESFILFKPRDIVSGDFYWFKEIHNNDSSYFLVTAADCTGHGVPGAFMSMLGISFLNEIANNEKYSNAAEILEDLRLHVKTSLKQTGKTDEAKDGMDISFCMIDKANMKLNFAGANNPLYLIRNGNLNIWKGDKNPIGIYLKEKDFTNHEIEIEKNDIIFMFSDGYVDQFGGTNGGKFKTKRFKEMLIEIQHKTMNEQKQFLEKTMGDWKGNNEQVDDILVIGIKI